MNVQDAKEKIIDLLDKLARDMSSFEYSALLDELGAEVEAREDCLAEEGA